jgi:hypothetical protein
MLWLGALLLVGATSSWALSPYVTVSGGGMEKDGGEVLVHVGASGWGAVQAVHVDVEYDPAGLALVGFTAGDLFAEPVVFGPFDRTERHVVDVQVGSLGGAVSPEAAEVGVFRFRVLDGARGDVRVVSFETAGADWRVEAHVSYANAVGVVGTPRVTRLLGGVPNPFNPETEVRFELAERGEVAVSVYDVSGREVRRLVEGVREAGVQSVVWDGRSDGGAAVSSGVYFVRMAAAGKVESKRLTLIR